MAPGEWTTDRSGMATKTKEQKRHPAQRQRQPGKESKMHPAPLADDPTYRAAGKLVGKAAIITGGDSGIGRAVAIVFAKEGADVAILHLPEERQDAEETAEKIRALGRQALLVAGDVGRSAVAARFVEAAVKKFGHLEIVVNNAGEQHAQDSVADITDDQLERTFRTNIFGQFYICRAALPHLRKGASIINTASVTAYQGNPMLIDYSSTKGAIVSFTRALSNSVAEEGIRVNAVAPGPIWTPLIPATFPAEKVKTFGKDVPLGRAGQPSEVATCYVFLASEDSSYITGQVLHPNGGRVVNG